MNKVVGFVAFLAVSLLVGCAGERQGFVCEEIEYRLNTMTYSPDQRAYMEEELRTCRVEEAKKKNESGQSNGSIYERFANTENTSSGDSSNVEIPVQTLAIGMIRIFQVADSLGQDRIAWNKPYNRFYVAHGESIEDGFYTGAGQKGLAAAGRNLETHMRHSGEHVFVRFHLFLTSHLYAFAFPQQRIGFRVIVILVQVAQIAFQILQHLGLILF